MYIWRQSIVCVHYIHSMHHQWVSMSVLWWELHSFPILNVWYSNICACGQYFMCTSCNIMHVIKHGTHITCMSSGVACGHINPCMWHDLCFQTKTSIHKVAWGHPKDAEKSACTLALGERKASHIKTSVHEIAKDAEARTIPVRN